MSNLFSKKKLHWKIAFFSFFTDGIPGKQDENAYVSWAKRHNYHSISGQVGPAGEKGSKGDMGPLGKTLINNHLKQKKTITNGFY